MATDDSESEAFERVTDALENTIVACGFGLVCAVGRLFGLTEDALHEVFEGMAGEVNGLVDLMEKGDGRLKKPPLSVVRGPTTTTSKNTDENTNSSENTQPPKEET